MQPGIYSTKFLFHNGSRDGDRVGKSYIIAHFQGAVHVFVHFVVIQGHEERVDADAERDKQLDERVVDERVDRLLEAKPVAGLAVPKAQEIHPPSPPHSILKYIN